jgi:hypothetical protein
MREWVKKTEAGSEWQSGNGQATNLWLRLEVHNDTEAGVVQWKKGVVAGARGGTAEGGIMIPRSAAKDPGGA